MIQNHEEQQFPQSVSTCVTNININSTIETTINNVCDQSVNRTDIVNQHCSSSLGLKNLGK